MRTRPITVFAVALALLAAVAPPAARAQDKFPADVQKVYDDYRSGGVIEVCDHTQATLESTLDTIKPDFDRDYPDFREAVEAGIDKHKDGGCGGDDSSTSDSSGGGTPPPATSTPGSGTSTAAPPAESATPDAGAESGTLPQATATVPPEDAIPPQAGATPVPTVPPAAPAATPTPAEPKIVHSGHRSLTLPIVLIAIALLGLIALALSALFARRNPRLQHAWREAAFRTRGTWADFSDWLRLGR
jgi:hypothetical protein